MSIPQLTTSLHQTLQEFSQQLISHNHAAFFQHLPTLDLISSYISLLASQSPSNSESAHLASPQALAELKETSRTVTMNIQGHIFAQLQQEREENRLLRQRIYEWIENEGLVPPVGYTFRFDVSDKLRRSVKQIETFCLKKTRERVLQAFQMKANGSAEEAQKLDLSGKEFTEMLESLDNFKEEIVHLVEYSQRYGDTSKEKFRAQAAELIAFNEILKSKSVFFASENMRLKQEMIMLKEQHTRMQKRVDAMVNENSVFRQQIDELHGRLHIASRRMRTPPSSASGSRRMNPATPDHISPGTSSPGARRSGTPLKNHFVKRPHSSTGSSRRSARRGLTPSVSPSPVLKMRASSSTSRREQQTRMGRDASHSQLLFEPPQLTRPHSSMTKASPRLSKDERMDGWGRPRENREELATGGSGNSKLQFVPSTLPKRRSSSALK